MQTRKEVSLAIVIVIIFSFSSFTVCLVVRGRVGNRYVEGGVAVASVFDEAFCLLFCEQRKH